MSDVIRMLTPMATPDSLRAFLRAKKNMYDLHTKRYFGYTDVDGLQYVGTAENFGSEMLFETRKLRMNRPPVEVVRPSEYMSYYFDLIPSDLINTYNQQNGVMACLKKDVLLPNHTYKIKFSHISTEHVLRSRAYSNEDVKHSGFLKTYTNPIIVVDDTYEYELFAQKKDNTDAHAKWFVQYDEVTKDLFTLTDNPGGWTEVIGDLSKFVDIPAFIVCVEDMEMQPKFDWHGIGNDGIDYGNKDQFMENPLLEYGTDGRGITRLYPYVYGPTNVPVLPHHIQQANWYLKVYGDFFSTDTNDNRNMTAIIHKIEYVGFDGDDMSQPVENYVMWYDERYVKISFLETLKHDDGTPRNTLGWVFRIPQPGDYDYDGMTYNNPIVAQIPLSTFDPNQTAYEDDRPYIPAFTLTFKDKYFHPYESEINNMDVGIHIDYTSDHSDHSISKKFGIAHDLCDFDGLPNYFKYYKGRTIHHSHIDLYAIRDDANERNQSAMDKQTAGIIIDSSVPLNDYGKITEEMEPVIVYDGPQSFRYKMLEDKIVSDQNFLSNIIGIDGNHFTDVNAPGNEGYQQRKKFIYHGNRHFSVGMIEFDEDVQYGRVYVISNDKASYENNGNTKNPKAGRTFARICDIPVSFIQLEHVPNLSPTIVIDDLYTRQPASFNDELFDRLWNGIHTRIFRRTFFKHWIEDFYQLKYFVDEEEVLRRNGFVPTPTRYVALSDINSRSGISISRGSGYAVNDTFGFNIGGIFIKGVVDEVDSGGIIRFHLIKNDAVPDQDWTFPNIDIPVTNFDGRISYYPVETLSGHGANAEIRIEIPTDLVNFDTLDNRTRTEIPDEAYAFAYRPEDKAGVCVIPFDFENHRWNEDQMTQITGELDKGDPYYENPKTLRQRSVGNTFLYNILTNRHCERDAILTYTNGQKSIELQTKKEDFIINGELNPITIEALVNGDDIHQLVSDKGMNAWNSFISVVPTYDRQSFRVVTWMYDMNASYIENIGLTQNNGNLIFPKFSNMHVDSYDGYMSSIKFINLDNGMAVPFMYDIMHNTYDFYTINDALRLSKQTVIDMKSLIPIKNYGYPEDVEEAYSGNSASYNIYRFDHFSFWKEMDSHRRNLTNMSTDDLYDEVIFWFGDDNVITHHYSYEEKEFVPNQMYRKDDLIVDHTLNVVPYRENTTYRKNTIVLDAWKRMYRVLHGYVSATTAIAYPMTPVEYDVYHGHLEFIGIKPLDNTDVVYRVLKAFRATSIDDDVEDGNIVCIGPSTKRQAIMNYLMENYYRTGELRRRPGLKLAVRKDEHLTMATPAGGYLPLYDILHENVTFGGSSRQYKVDPLYVFRIDEQIPDLTNFRLYDTNGIDISSETLLIVKQQGGFYRKYVFHNDQWEWDYTS